VVSEAYRTGSGLHRVVERVTLVAEQRCRVVAAHLLRYGTGEEVGQGHRGSAEINRLLFWPDASYGAGGWTRHLRREGAALSTGAGL
jgi:hypothetical protein